jgi:CRP/FNR family cyclic AMP-dependent transcriptional regulator
VEENDKAANGSLLTYLEPADREFLLNLGVRRAFQAGELLLRQGDPTNHVLLILSGWVRVFSSTQDGQEILVALRGPGDVVGDQSALHGWPRTASVQTLEKVTAIQVLRAEFANCLQQRPNIAIAMIKQMSERLREAEIARVDFATLDVTRRVATYLMRLMQQHGVREQGGLVLRMPLTQQDIANRVGASRRAVARSMAALRKRRLVATFRRRIVVAQPDALSRFARSE